MRRNDEVVKEPRKHAHVSAVGPSMNAEVSKPHLEVFNGNRFCVLVVCALMDTLWSSKAAALDTASLVKSLKSATENDQFSSRRRALNGPNPKNMPGR